tara:strand:+ start:15894 stop:16124 length:231 start_codon:yes stop_codon:yes gene_type:complete
MRVRKNITLNIEVVKAFEEVVPAYQRSRVIDALILEYLVKHYEIESNTGLNEFNIERVTPLIPNDSSLTTEKEKRL